MSTTSLTLEDLADEIRFLYYDTRRDWQLTHGCPPDQLPGPNSSWDGGEDKYGRRHGDIWRRIAAFYLEQNLDPRLLVQAVFERAVGGDPPFPSMLMGQAALALGTAYREREKKLVRAEVDAEKEMISSFIILSQHAGRPDREVWRKAVLHPELTNDLVRYVLALSCVQLDLAEKCKIYALREYLRHPESYEDLLGGELPSTFREEALRLKAFLLQR